MPASPIPDAVLFRIVEVLVADAQPIAEVLRIVNTEFPSVRLTRETIYPLLPRAWKAGFVRLVPPIEDVRARELEKKYSLPPGSIRVVACPRPESNASVSVAAAVWAMELLESVRKEVTGALGLGLGPGRATLDFSRAFSQLLAAHPAPPKLDLIAISAGCPARYPEFSSISFFNLFGPALVHERIGLFAETLVPQRDFAAIQTRPGVREGFTAKQEGRIHLVVTSMGDMDDPHALLRCFLADSGRWPDGRGDAVGDVQYRPFSATGFIKERRPTDLRAVTLFELDELVRLARERFRRVLLIARQCGACKDFKRTRAKPLRPLLENPHMRVFSHLIMDSATAQELLA